MDGTAALVIALIVGSAYVAAIAYALVQIVRTGQLADIEKIVWVVVLLGAPLIGAVVWYFAGPHPLGLRLTSSAK